MDKQIGGTSSVNIAPGVPPSLTNNQYESFLTHKPKKSRDVIHRVSTFLHSFEFTHFSFFIFVPLLLVSSPTTNANFIASLLSYTASNSYTSQLSIVNSFPARLHSAALHSTLFHSCAACTPGILKAFPLQANCYFQHRYPRFL